MSNTPRFQDAPFAFNEAISEGRLSTDPNSPKYAGKYMYMGDNHTGVSTFKNIRTRQYLGSEDSCIGFMNRNTRFV
jgi:hypothetical protein